jgi:wobble nucleotide-excising tRNase
MTITKIDIPNFGSFNNFSWKKSIKNQDGNSVDFKRVNVLYGRNYSGKTTLSRIIRSLETGRLPANYAAPAFTVFGDKGDVHQSGISTHNYDVRVYNRDFVTDNLSFLVNQEDGEIRTFAIVGEKNKEIEDKIAEIESKLGSVETNSGLKNELVTKRNDKDQKARNHNSADSAFSEKLKGQAKFLKDNRDYVPAVYTIIQLNLDIVKTNLPGYTALNQSEITSGLELLKQDVLADIPDKVSIKLEYPKLSANASTLLQKTITPTKAIQELLNDSVLQLWVKQGILHHRDKRTTCGFCRQPLPDDIWQVLDSHFSRESTDLESEIDTAVKSVEAEIKSVSTFISITSDKFYPDEKSSFETEKTALATCLKSYEQDLLELKKALQKRKNNLFEVVDVPLQKHDSTKIDDHVKSINELIEKNNNRSKNLDKDKASVKDNLRLADVSTFLASIDYASEKIRIEGLKTESLAAANTFTTAEKEISDLEKEVTVLRGKQRDEKKGAARVNNLLKHFFGHDGLELVAEDIPGLTSVKFQIMRDGKSAFNLSEGECSLIAFCYFIAKLEEPESKDKDLIIYIDDPISSLDTNHIFFMFSLIESFIAKPKKVGGVNQYGYRQLFVSTHNLDFLKYLKNLSMPKDKHGGAQHFIIERNGAASNINLMPSYLKDYITEFNYLFHQIYKCRNPEMAIVNHEPFFSFGNNLRKFLEAFLFYKYPYHDNSNVSSDRLRKFFGDDDTATALISRLDNELSHLEAVFDRSMKPIEIPEISKIANYVLEKMFDSDPDQYNALLKSIGEPERAN